LTALQIVSNRARSVCYAVRQQHFRARAEQAVNQLMASSEQQLSALMTMSQTQQQLKATADSTIERLETGRQQIANDHQQLRHAHRVMNAQLLRNVQHIQQEKEVIIAGNKQLITNTEQIREKLDSTAQQVSEQAEVESARHQELLRDLTQLDAQAKDVSSKLDVSLMVVENFQHAVIERQQDAIENLKHINETVNFLLSLVTSVRGAVEVKLEWILHLAASADIRMAVLTVIAAHIACAVVALVLCTLLRTTWRVCCLLLTLILLNAVAELKFNSGLRCAQLAAVVLAVVFVSSVVRRCWPLVFQPPSRAEPVARHGSGADRVKCDDVLSCEDVKHVMKTLERLSADFRRRMSGSHDDGRVDSVQVSSSTPIRRVREVGSESVSSGCCETVAGCLLNSTPPPIRRHVLAVSPSPLSQSSLLNDTGILRLPLVSSPGGSRPSSPAGSASSAGTPRTAHRRKSRAASLSRSFSRSVCIATTKSGQGCKLPSQDGSSFCHRHQLN